MSESEQRMNNTQSENDANTSEQRWDLGTLFPAKGDSRKPPEWLGRALLYIAIAIVVFTFCWRSWGKIEYLVIDIIVSLFIALAVEPMVVPLVKHGWKRSFASLFSLLMLAVILGVLFTLFGNLFVQQVIALVNGLPDLYEQMCQFVSQYANFRLPEINNLGNEILKNIHTSWVTDFAGTALNTVSGLFSFLINLMTVIMTTYYISAAGPKLRRAACQWMAPAAQRRFLFVWTVSQSQISSFLFSRAILALLNAFFTGICLMLLHVPYWLPLALFCGMVSQFIPMLGTYIGGALPVVASVQTIFRTYTKRYELVDSPLMDDPVPEKKSKLVEGAEVLSEHLHNMPRAVQGSSAHVPISDEVRQLQEQAYNISRSEESLESNETVAIPKHVLDKTERKPLQGLESENTSQESNENPESGNERKNGESREAEGSTKNADDNPRSRWR